MKEPIKRILVIDVGGTNVKVLVTGMKEPVKIPSGPKMTAQKMVDEVRKATADWKYSAVSIGYPAPVAYLVLLAELGGGLALIVGLWTRWIALILFVEMLGVIVYHWPNGFVFTSKGGGWEYPAMWAIALLVQSLLGDGPYAISERLRPQPAT